MTSTTDLLHQVALEMKKQPSDFQKYIDVLNDNFLETTDELKELSDAQWAQM